MKLLFIHDHPFYREGNFVYSGGGLPFYVWDNYLKYFSKVIIYGRLSKKIKDKKVESSGNDNCSFYLTENYKSAVDLLFNYQLLVSELSFLIKNVDVVLVRLPSVLGFIGARVARKNNKKIIIEQVGNAREALSSFGSLLGILAAPLFDFINKKIVANADYVVYVTENKLQKDYPANKAITVSISNVIINEIVDVANDKENLDRRFGKKIFKIGLIGGFDVRYKGQNLLIEAVNLLPSQIKDNIQMYFVGKGDYNWVIDTAKKYDLHKQIQYIGVKKYGKDIFDFLDTLSLYIQPSLTEGMPRALIEAMSRGCPVIGSDVGGIPDVVNKDFIHKKGDFEKISEHIERLFIDRKLLMAESARSTEAAKPYLKTKLDKKRDKFFNIIIKDLSSLNDES